MSLRKYKYNFLLSFRPSKFLPLRVKIYEWRNPFNNPIRDDRLFKGSLDFVIHPLRADELLRSG